MQRGGATMKLQNIKFLLAIVFLKGEDRVWFTQQMCILCSRKKKLQFNCSWSFKTCRNLTDLIFSLYRVCQKRHPTSGWIAFNSRTRCQQHTGLLKEVVQIKIWFKWLWMSLKKTRDIITFATHYNLHQMFKIKLFNSLLGLTI